MDLEKVDWLLLWEVLRIYGVGGKLLSAIKLFYEEASLFIYFYLRMQLKGKSKKWKEKKNSLFAVP